jgi:mannosyltransferase
MPAANHDPLPPGRIRAAVLLVLVALALRCYGLGDESFWIDEVFQRDIAAQPLATIVTDYRPHPGEPERLRDQAPLSHLLFHFFVGDAVGDEATARLPSAVAGALAAGLFYLIAVRLVPAGTAALAVALLVFSPLDLWYSQECRFYELWMLLATASTYALLRVLKHERLGWWAAYALCTIAALYTCMLHALVVAAQVVTLAWVGARTGRLAAIARSGAIALAFVGLATLPITWVVLGEHARGAGTPRPPSLSVLPYTLFAFAAGFSLGPTVESLHALPSVGAVVRAHPSVVVVGLVFGLAAVAGLRRVARWPEAAPVLVPLLFLPPLGVFVLSLVTPVVYNVRYALPALTAFLVVVAAGGIAPRRPAIRALAVAAMLAVTLVADAGFYGEPRYDKAQARHALAFVAAHGGSAHVLYVGQLWRVVDYYTRGTATTWQSGCAVDSTAAATGTLWVAASRDWEHASPTCLDGLEATHRIAEYRPFVGIELWRLEPR